MNFKKYLEPAYVMDRKKQNVERLDACLQALRNVHQTLGRIPGGDEDAYEAITLIYEAYLKVKKLHEKTQKGCLES